MHADAHTRAVGNMTARSYTATLLHVRKRKGTRCVIRVTQRATLLTVAERIVIVDTRRPYRRG